jgi:hypothetical protein
VFLNRFNQFRESGTNVGLAELGKVELYITHKNLHFEAICVSGDILMGRTTCPYGLKMHVLKSHWLSGKKVTACIFHPIDQILIIGQENGTVVFYKFTDDLKSMSPSFTLNLFQSLPFSGIIPSCVSRITSNPSGRLFIIEYKHYPSVLVSMDSDKISMGIDSITFFGENMMLSNQNKKYCVWDLSDLRDIKLLSEIEPIMRTDGSRQYYPWLVEQIIPCGKSSFLCRKSEMIFFVRLGDDFKTCSVVVELPVYGEFSASTKIDLEMDSIALYGKMLILVVPSKCVVKFFLLEDDAIHLLLTKQIETPTCWSYDPRTSVFGYYYTSCDFTYHRQFRV